MNKILLGDCIQVMKKLPDNSVDLVYLDPPFFTQKEHSLKTRDGSQFYNFSDRWKDIDEYITSLSASLREAQRVLKPTGSLFLHCDKTAVHYLKVAADKIFGIVNFQSEIIWSYRRWSNSKKGLLNNHQTLLFYSKTSEFKFNAVMDEYSPSTNVEQIVQLRVRDGRNKSVYKKNSKGEVELCESKNGVPMGDVWDIPFLNPKARERVSYPTQKPILLLERILLLTTDKGDLVLDPYCGSGTTLVAAKLLGRKFIGIDKNNTAIKLATSRIHNPVKTESNLLKKGRQSYKRNDSKVDFVLKKLKATAVQRNSGIDGLISIQNQVVPVKIAFTSDQLKEAALKVQKSTQKNKFLNRAIFLDEKIGNKAKLQFEKKYHLILFESLVELEKKLIKLS